ncbi:hypothetical protein [Sediminicoccus sp. KRV36]|uniref:hypothetical protein n=1 Tax=Sediminicoccus sp. KRV36 TaxID=3133721 RepID=UPI00200E4321|nr:hypothetical protein [Sediminicoccus rosea]UPY38588.1 hypothetical protein LHU95_07795 [Sediminicoccus rosea]
MIRRALLALPLLAGCAGVAVPDPVRLPRDSVDGAGDPTRAAVSRSAYAFADQTRLRGQPGDMARAIADMEFLAAALPFDPRFQQRDPLLPWQLAQARAEWRAALGIEPAQPAQPVIDSLYAVARASAQGQMVALPAGLFTPDGAAGTARLGAMPPLPQTARAASAAARLQAEAQFPVGRWRR